MIQNKLVQILLFPFSLLFGIAVSFRNLLYDTGVLRSAGFSIPVISVGNLSIGGTGKTPHIEYLIRLLNSHLHIATLSRGYKRKTKGFRFVNARNTVHDAGDEPLVYKRKYRDVVVAVSESRVVGIPSILQKHPEIQLILLDDAFQHRSVTPGLNILLTEYTRPFFEDFLMPSGRLREWRSAYKRADSIIVTKCPQKLDEAERSEIVERIRPSPDQKVYFSYYKYGTPYYMFDPYSKYPLNRYTHVLLVSAIAHTDYLYSYLESEVMDVDTAIFEDHHYFSHHDLSQLKIAFDKIKDKYKVILTTEKDAVRLAEHKNFIRDNQLPVYLLPAEVQFHFNEGPDFNRQIRKFLLDFKV